MRTSRSFRSRVTLRTILVAVLGAACGGAFAACASEGVDAAPPIEAGSDSALLGDTTPPADAEPDPGDPCGRAEGLQPDAPWALRGGCPKRAGIARTSGPQDAKVKWSVPAHADGSSPAIDAGRIVWFGTTDGDVLAVGANGAVLSTLHAGAPIRSSPAIGTGGVGGIALLGSTDGVLYGLTRGVVAADGGDDGGDAGDASDGGTATPVLARVLFQKALAPIASSPLVGPDGTIYIGTSDGQLIALAPDLSSVRWSVATHDTAGASPALANDGTVYVGSSDGHLYAVSKDGKLKWTFDTAGSAAGSPAIGGEETVYVPCADGKLYAVTPDGHARWIFAAGGPLRGTPAISAAVAYVGSDDKKLHAISLADGKERWAFATLGAVASPVVDKGGTIYTGSTDGHLYAITPGGTLFFAVNVKGAVTTSPAVSDDGTLYVTTNNALVAIGP